MPRKQKRKTHRVLRVFLASPSDVKAERAGIANAIDEVNESLSSAGIYYELIRWETHGAVGMGRPQDLVNGLVDQCDVFIGILWKKFGSPPGKSLSGTTFDSGTEEEFQRAYQRWCTNGGRADSQPRVMFFFCNRPVHPHDLNVDQFGKVLRFSEQFKPGGAHPGLYKEFIDLENLQRDVRRLLSTPQV